MTETTKQRGKGKPTPKRSEAVAKRRKPVVTPRGGAARGPKLDKAERAELRRKVREAMRTGDEKYYPPMHAGPEKSAVRDAVDARRSFGWLAIPGWFVGLVLSSIPSLPTQLAGSILMPLVLGVLVADSIGAARAVRRMIDERFPDGTKHSRRGLTWYGVSRNMQFRRMRTPVPRVQRGETA